jgi:hypothetical protein
VPGLGNCCLHAVIVERLLQVLGLRAPFLELCIVMFGTRHATLHATSLASLLHEYKRSRYNISRLVGHSVLDELTQRLRERVVDVMDE